VDRLIEKTALHEDWPLHKCVLLSHNCLPSRRPLWTNIHPTDIISQWQDDWSRPQWSTLPLWMTPLSIKQDPNCHDDTGHKETISGLTKVTVQCASCHNKWGFATSGKCQCANVKQCFISPADPSTDQTGWVVCRSFIRLTVVDDKWLVNTHNIKNN